MLDAVRTCVASKQTLKLLTMLPQIVIVLAARELVRKNALVADVTDRILSVRSPQIPIRNLKLKFIMRDDDHLKIGRSVALAMAMRLESLRFILCDSGVHSVLRVEHPRLVVLDITDGYFSTVELSYLPKLQRMSYSRWHYAKNPLVLGFVPRLSNLSLSSAYAYSDNTINLSQLLANVPLITDLHLDFQSEKVCVHQEFGKLLAPLLRKFWVYICTPMTHGGSVHGIAWTLSFLEAAPSLEELCITVSDHKCEPDSRQDYTREKHVKWEPSVADFKHKNLAKLTIHGFESPPSSPLVSVPDFTSYIKCVMKVAVNIREISLHDRKVCICSNKSSPSRYPRTRKEEAFLRKKITEALVTASPDVIHFRLSSYYSSLNIEYYV
ncbi:unnamed protein product [Alopecurus aequalis]